MDSLSADTWMHIALTWDDATDTVKIYKNGSPVYTATGKAGPLAATNWNLRMGYANYYNPYNYWNGYIDDVRVYDRALTDDEIAANYNDAGDGMQEGLDMLDGPKAQWDLDEHSGSTAYDSAGSNDGTIYGASWITGPLGGALSFDGVNDYVDAGNGSDLQPSSAITLEAWVYPKSTDPMQAIIKGDPRSNGYTLGMGYGQIEFGLALATPISGQRVSSLAANKWTHIALTWDDDTDTVIVYKDGGGVHGDE